MEQQMRLYSPFGIPSYFSRLKNIKIYHIICYNKERKILNEITYICQEYPEMKKIWRNFVSYIDFIK